MTTKQRMLKALHTPPYPYQVEGVRFLNKTGGRALLLDDMGLGKTYQFIAWLALNPDARPCVIVCPATIKFNWQRELREHAGIRSEVLSGREPYTPRRNVLIINYEIMEAWADTLRKLKVRTICLDECHYISNRAAKRTKAVRSVASKCKHRILLSGTAISNAPVEFFCALQIVAPKVFTSFWEYAYRYCDPKRGWGGRPDFRGASNLKELHRRIRPFMLRRLKRKVLKDLPKKRRIVVPIEIDNRREYDKAKRDFLAWLVAKKGTKALKAARGALALVRLGALKKLAAEGKLKAAIQWIQDWLAETKRKLVVFAVHRDILTALQKKFPKAAVITGSTPLRKRQAAVDRFRKNKQCRLFLGQIKAAGTGVNGLQVASATLTLELGWNEAVHSQADDRVLRIGQKASSVENYYLIGKDTIEEWLLEVLHSKQIVVDKVLEGKRTKGRASLMTMLDRIT